MPLRPWSLFGVFLHRIRLRRLGFVLLRCNFLPLNKAVTAEAANAIVLNACGAVRVNCGINFVVGQHHVIFRLQSKHLPLWFSPSSCALLRCRVTGLIGSGSTITLSSGHKARIGDLPNHGDRTFLMVTANGSAKPGGCSEEHCSSCSHDSRI